jgi:hypothetical protein
MVKGRESMNVEGFAYFRWFVLSLECLEVPQEYTCFMASSGAVARDGALCPDCEARWRALNPLACRSLSRDEIS